MMAGTRDGTLILGEIGRGREDGATAAGGKRDSVLISGKTTEDSDAATAADCKGDCTSISDKVTGE